ncbi:prenyltransferase/squalene oxidase repeat-containing protein [Sphaerobacter sp.]|uniref:prenyltransferase/squalene oxidase repeat-containing protein n=1 Tax=Sphaerobacter sp. TaxID=2099654 RepID=UPI001E021580|nr:prenyltransferase/squalene oxidase repeat-containing protein [Sphaerobacter sp.]MBX5444002.1 terpene cyclase/mutase family protein [Sphaerobacter sp.]
MQRTITTLVLASLLWLVMAPAARGSPNPELTRAVDWLRSQQQPDGGFAGATGASEPGITADAALAFAASGIDPDLVAAGGPSIIDYLRTTAGDYAGTVVGAAKLTPVAVASGVNPRDFGRVDLLARILAHLDQTTGLFDPQPANHAFAILALEAAREPVPAAAVDALIAAQAMDGGWSSGQQQPARRSDSRATALAIQALVAAGKRGSTAVDRGIGYLLAAQTDDGSFVSQVGADVPAVGDATSTALATQAMLAAGERATSDTVAAGIAALERLQNDSGALRARDDVPSDSLLATAQAVPALALQPLPIPARPDFGRRTAMERAMQPASPKEGCAYYAATGHNLCAGFLSYWLAYGGLAVYGYPLTEEFVENGRTVQYFERARFEWYPGMAPERFDVLLGRIGAEQAADRAGSPSFAPAEPIQRPDCLYFPQTHHNLCGGFNEYWQRYGALSVYGYPISEEIVENGRTVQYFERARLEWHPGTAWSHYDVLVGRLGDELLTHSREVK